MQNDFDWGLPESCFKAPDFWVGGLDECHDFARSLPGVEIIEVGTSAGGRPILAAAYGEREPVERTSTSLSSSMGEIGGKAWDFDTLFRPASFFGPEPREKPVLVIQGNIHGSEISGTVAAMNLLNLMAHGVDLRGRANDRLRDLAMKMRLVVIPHANPDGRARWEPARHLVGVEKAIQQRLTMGWLADGTPLTWPTCKGLFPIPAGGVLGAYYNDTGVNLNHDRWLGHDRAPETDALLAFYLDELPDAVIMSHTDQGTLLGGPPRYVPEEVQRWHDRMAGAVTGLVRERGLPVYSYPHWSRAGGMSRTFNQADAIWHHCGAMPILCEFPISQPGNAHTHESILDVGLTALEALCAWGVDMGFLPCLRKHLVDGRVITRYGKLKGN